jgi:hypothetical protein
VTLRKSCRVSPTYDLHRQGEEVLYFLASARLAAMRAYVHGHRNPALQGRTSPLRDSDTSRAPAAVAAAR